MEGSRGADPQRGPVEDGQEKRDQLTSDRYKQTKSRATALIVVLICVSAFLYHSFPVSTFSKVCQAVSFVSFYFSIDAMERAQRYHARCYGRSGDLKKPKRRSEQWSCFGDWAFSVGELSLVASVMTVLF